MYIPVKHSVQTTLCLLERNRHVKFTAYPGVESRGKFRDTPHLHWTKAGEFIA